VAHGDYERLTPETIDQLWVRLKGGQAAKPTSRELGLSSGRCGLNWFGAAASAPSRVAGPRAGCREREREETSRGLAAGLVACNFPRPTLRG
jgi:transposase, IS30 family